MLSIDSLTNFVGRVAGLNSFPGFLSCFIIEGGRRASPVGCGEESDRRTSQEGRGVRRCGSLIFHNNVEH